jgi:hypothetical protein
MNDWENILGESVSRARREVRVSNSSAPIGYPQALARLNASWSRMDYLNLGNGLLVTTMIVINRLE